MNEIQSPCILVCAIEPNSGHCYGCGRTRDEIAEWLNYSDEQRAILMDALPSRTEKLERRPRRVTRRAKMAAEKTQTTEEDGATL